MRVASAIELIGQLVYKPGWQFQAEDHTSRYENSICLTIRYPAVNSDRAEACQGFPNGIRPDGLARASFCIMLGNDSDLQLYRKVSDCIMEIEYHEMREFLRVKPTFWAPFHPHNLEGIERWAAATDQTFANALMYDKHFGLA